ncbi:hypothetical protein K501DRAFT_275620 [Backusella circina FSU 941]|nr:hypothetical protein K501DRAFT_275620 [Backusella circina FSU 941]
MDAIVSTLFQRAFGQSFGFGEIKLGRDSTTNHSLCVDTLKLFALSGGSILKHSHPILTFQVNAITQMVRVELIKLNIGTYFGGTFCDGSFDTLGDTTLRLGQCQRIL